MMWVVFVIAKIVEFSPLCSVEAEEAMILYNALHCVAYLRLDNMDFVLHSKKVVDCFSTRSSGITEFSCIMNACKQLFNLAFKTLMSSFPENIPMGSLIF